MNFLKKGPEIKLSEIKVPNFLVDVYYDLKERHLLPVAAILIVAIVAVPIALSQSSGSEGESTEAGSPLASTSSASAETHELVAKSMPGLRAYQRRLGNLRAKDPFKQQYTKPEGGSESSGESGSEGSEANGSESGETTSSGTEPAGTEPSTEGSEGEPTGKLRYYSYAIDVRVSSAAGQSESSAPTDGAPQTPKNPSSPPKRTWTTRHNLPELTMLPSREIPAVIYMGSTKDGKKALMLVSSNVTAVFGDATCVLGSKSCELLAMEPGLPETFVYGASGKTYKIELLKVHLVETKKLNRAALGKPKQKNGSAG